ncbi:hypothetical protein AXX17_AT1G72960 [Arabidopsis thaliana]|uniref:Uncharacterized protein n=1 Tax=Arabidopsis thaliana TaxID=3702 RepID=A0A178W6H4_ARATH|nr:hypothetical protein AXX17_AT1G72960 [Arabidopsis thaliana]
MIHIHRRTPYRERSRSLWKKKKLLIPASISSSNFVALWMKKKLLILILPSSVDICSHSPSSSEVLFDIKGRRIFNALVQEIWINGSIR